MRSIRLTLAAALVASLSLQPGPAIAAPAGPAGPLDDFGCLVRTMYMADAADNVAGKTDDAEKKASTQKVATEAWEAVSYYIGRLAAGKPIADAASQYDRIFAAVKALPTEQSSKEISQCMERSRTERGAYVQSLMHETK